MKRLFIASTIFMAFPAFAQLKAGKILYERTIKPKILIVYDGPDFENIITGERKDNFELVFSEGKSLWQHVEEQHDDDEMSLDVSFDGDEGMLTTNSARDNVIYHNLAEGVKMEQTELGDKRYIIMDSVRKMTWKITEETKTILGYNCTKATTQQIKEVFRMSVSNGEPTRETMTDTLAITAWFTDDIPGSVGPEIYQGQLPGTILEIDLNNGRSNFKAIEISLEADVAKIKEPSKGKRTTPEAFAREKEKLIQEIKRNKVGPKGQRVEFRN